MSSAIYSSLLSIPFFSFSCLIALVRPSSTTLKRSGRNRHPCLVSVFRGETCSFLPLNVGCFVDVLYSTEEVPSYL